MWAGLLGHGQLRTGDGMQAGSQLVKIEEPKALAMPD